MNDKGGVHEIRARNGVHEDREGGRAGKLDRRALGRELRREVLELKEGLASSRPPSRAYANGALIAEEPQVAHGLPPDARTRLRDDATQRSVLVDRSRQLLRGRLRRANRYFLSIDARECDRLTLDPATTGGWTSSDREEVRGALEIALNLLPHEDRQAIRWFYLEQRTTAEIARRQGVREATVWLQLKEARARFRELFATWNEIFGS